MTMRISLELCEGIDNAILCMVIVLANQVSQFPNSEAQ